MESNLKSTCLYSRSKWILCSPQILEYKRLKAFWPAIYYLSRYPTWLFTRQKTANQNSPYLYSANNENAPQRSRIPLRRKYVRNDKYSLIQSCGLCISLAYTIHKADGRLRQSQPYDASQVHVVLTRLSVCVACRLVLKNPI